MQTAILGLLAETFIHPGAGSTGGAIDLPVAREAATGYPYIPGSSLKGALRDRAEQTGGWDDNQLKKVFGQQESAGGVLVSDARLLLLPVRSLSGPYLWATCPLLLERLGRDFRRSEIADLSPPELPTKPGKGQILTAAAASGARVYLEERSFTVAAAPGEGLVETLRKLIHHPDTGNRLNQQLAILSDEDFAWFASYGLAVQARNVLNENKTSNNLWYEETLPPDTLMYALLAERSGGAVGSVAGLFATRPYLQAGGNETVGQGWFAVQVLGTPAEAQR
ncbi:type III-B CRISPR module RAMP protein Cmr4 [Candidatus Methylocalor cossyra]|uniref:Type III-B CRISPR module RAMP protein Cmr4 n=1 Tax=Candidatus Methylocalor cossyra TaxID=3108543 RepID=A0ABP1CAA9_9GAMM